eukprot:gene15567-17144_t
MSTVSAPDDLNFSKRESTSDSVRAQSEIQIKVSSRRKRFTEKGKSYLKELRGRGREKAYQQVETQDQFNAAHQAFHCLLDTNEKDESYRWYDVRDREFTDFRVRLCERIQRLERGSYRSQPSVVSSRTKMTSASRPSSHRSSMRSVSFARTESAAKAAKLRLELDFIDKENELKRLRLEKDYPIAVAEERAFQQILEEEKRPENNQNEQCVENKSNVVSHSLNPGAPSFTPSQENKECSINSAIAIPDQGVQPADIGITVNQLANLQVKQTELSSLILNQQRVSQLPVREPPTFSGDSFE